LTAKDDKGTEQQSASGQQASEPKDAITQQLRAAYQNVVNEPIPDELSALLDKLKQDAG